MKTKRLFNLFLFAILLVPTLAVAQGTEFTYQGKLNDGAAAANANYDFEFRLYDAGGTQIGSTNSRNGVAVTAGIFSVNLDFGPGFPGADRFLEIAVRTTGGGAFTILTPRQKIASSPYSVKSLTATTADTATSAVNFTGNLSGDVTGTQAATAVTRLQGRNLSATVPVAGQVLKYNGVTNQWEPNTDETGTGSGGGTITAVVPGTGLSGGGTSGSVSLSIANGGVGTTQIADASVTDPKIAAISPTKITGAVANSNQLGGIPANQYVQTTDPRMTDARNPLPSSTNYVQNRTTPQSSTDFNISGTGSASVINATTAFNLGGSRVLSNPGTENLFAGVNAGAANTGFGNSFFGWSAGQANASGANNTFVGWRAGALNTTGTDNVFVGYVAGGNGNGSRNSFFGFNAGGQTSGTDNTFVGAGAGLANTTGIRNSFVGNGAGLGNQTGNSNAALGYQASFGANNLTFATAIGAGSAVATSNTVALGRAADTVQIPGDLNVAGSLTANINGASITNLNASNIATGTLNNARLGVVPVANGGTGSATQNFVDLTTAQTIGGDKTFSNILSGNVVNATFGYNIGNSRVLSAGGSFNIFAGSQAGSDTTGGGNAFFGARAGLVHSSGINNSYFGRDAGIASTIGFENSFFGTGAGLSTNEGSGNSFFGRAAGFSNTTGTNNTIIGSTANVTFTSLDHATAIGAGALVGASNTVVLGRAVDTVSIPSTHLNLGEDRFLNRAGTQNTFVGVNAGTVNTGADNTFLGTAAGNANGSGGDNTFVGVDAGGNNVAGNSNTFIGRDAGDSSTGSNNTALGAGSDVGSGLTFATAIGSGVTATISSRIQLGRPSLDSVAIGTLPGGGPTPVCHNFGLLSACSSSLRYKTKINRFGQGLDLIMHLKPITFDWKDGGMHDLGLGAEDVAAIEPLLVTHNDKGEVEGVKYDRIGVVLVNAVKEQQSQIERQQKQLEKQQLIIDGLRQLACSKNKRVAICRRK